MERDIFKEKLAELELLGFDGNYIDEQELEELHIVKGSIKEAMLFCEIKINEYWVDIPVSLRDEAAKECAKKCNVFKKILKELKDIVKQK